MGRRIRADGAEGEEAHLRYCALRYGDLAGLKPLASKERGAPGARHRGRRYTWTACERSEEHTSELQSRFELVCRLLLEKRKTDGDKMAGGGGPWRRRGLTQAQSTANAADDGR